MCLDTVRWRSIADGAQRRGTSGVVLHYDFVYLIRPMADDPPPAFVAYVCANCASLRQEAARLAGGNADEIYSETLADLALHWRRLLLATRFKHTAAADYMARRLRKRAARWRAEQVYEIKVEILRPQYRPYPDHLFATIAQRKAALLAPTESAQIRPVAEATIAWSHAQRTAFWRGVIRTVAIYILLQYR